MRVSLVPPWILGIRVCLVVHCLWVISPWGHGPKEEDPPWHSKTRHDTRRSAMTLEDPPRHSKIRHDTRRPAMTLEDPPWHWKIRHDTGRSATTLEDPPRHWKIRHDTRSSATTLEEPPWHWKIRHDTRRPPWHSKTRCDTGRSSVTLEDPPWHSKIRHDTGRSARTLEDPPRHSKFRHDTGRSATTLEDPPWHSKTRCDTRRSAVTLEGCWKLREPLASLSLDSQVGPWRTWLEGRAGGSQKGSHLEQKPVNPGWSVVSLWGEAAWWTSQWWEQAAGSSREGVGGLGGEFQPDLDMLQSQHSFLGVPEEPLVIPGFPIPMFTATFTVRVCQGWWAPALGSRAESQSLVCDTHWVPGLWLTLTSSAQFSFSQYYC